MRPHVAAETERHHLFLHLHRLGPPSVRTCAGWVPTRADADDVMQEVSVVLQEKVQTFRERCRHPGLGLRVALRSAGVARDQAAIAWCWI